MTNTLKRSQSCLPPTESDDGSPSSPDLRTKAEQVTGKTSALSQETIKAMPPEEVQRLIHELGVHQVELTLQNEELRRAHLNLDAERSRYADLYDHAPVGYCTLNEENLLLVSNRTLANLLGVAPGALSKQPFTRFIYKEDQDLYYLYRKNLAKTDKPQECELRMQQEDGTILWAQLVGATIPQVSGSLEYRLVISDITDRKIAVFALQESETQLMQAQKMESVGRLAGGVAHDFNNMLSIILVTVEKAEEDVEENSKIYEALQEIKKAAQHSAELTHRLLAFARKQIVVPRVLDINDTVEESFKMLRYLIGEHIRLTWLPYTSLWPVRIDPSQVEQILANLCVNARDSIPENGEIRIETRNITLDAAYCADHPDLIPGDFVELTVSDNGLGMDAKTLNMIYEPFFTTKAVDVGNGLGLSTVHGIVMQNKGRITVSSEPGQGTTFRMYLPRSTEPVKAQGRNEQGPLQHEHKTVLLVEHEAALLHLNTRILESLGFTVIVAAAPFEALLLAEEHPGNIDLLLTDVILPEMSGRELALRLHQMYPDMKELFMSGYTADILASHGISDNSLHFLHKPFSRRELAAKIDEVFS